MKLYLNPYALITKGQGNDFQFWGNNQEAPFGVSLTAPQIQVLDMLKQGACIEESLFADVFSAEVLEHFRRVDILTADRLDVQSVHSRRNAFYRNYGLQNAGEQLAEKHVLILGCGGIGTHMAWHMAVMGVEKITLLDFDSVEPSNLNRQILYSLEDVGAEKTAALKRYIQGINPDICVQTLNQKISSMAELYTVCANTDPDLIIKALDSPAEFPMWLDQVCTIQKIPYIAGITMRENAMIGPTFLPGKSEIGWSHIVDLTSSPTKYSGTAPSMGAVLYHVSDELAVEAFKVLTGTGTPKYTGKILLRNLFTDQEQVLKPNTMPNGEAAPQKRDSRQAAVLGCYSVLALGLCAGSMPGVLVALATVLILPHILFSMQSSVIKYTLSLTVLYALSFCARMIHVTMKAAMSVNVMEMLPNLVTTVGVLSIFVLGMCMINYYLAAVKSKFRAQAVSNR